jgi:CubicO group peptidase (beta-lactamase class C family)
MAATAVHARQVDFSGAWTVNSAKTGIAGLPAYTVRIVQSDAEIDYSTTVPQPGGPALTSRRVMPLDGREVSWTDHRGKVLPCSATLRGSQLVIRFQSEQMRRGSPVLLQMEEEHSLSPDGRVMSVVHREGAVAAGRMGSYPNPIVFDRVAGPGDATVAAAVTSPPARRRPVSRTDVVGQAPDAVEAALRKLVEEGGAPSVSAAILVDGKIVWARNDNGVAGLDTVYAIGSISKPFTATAVLQLVENGRIRLDDDVSGYLPFRVRHPSHPDTAITVRMLLTHRSGLTKDTPNYHRFSTFRDADLVKFGASLGIDLPHFTPRPVPVDFYQGLLIPGGTHYTPDVWAAAPGQVRYSNIGFGLLTLVVERASEMPFEAYVRRHLLEPLGMSLSGFEKSRLEAQHAPPMERLSGPVMQFFDRKLPVTERMKPAIEDGFLRLPLHDLPPGPVGLRTTVKDLALFMSAHMGDGRASNGHRLLAPDTVTLMHQVAAPTPGAAIDIFPLAGQGMGWAVGTDGVGGHIGGQLGYTSAMIQKRTPRHTVGFIVLINMGTRLEPDAADVEAWWRTYYGPLERALLDAAELLGAASPERSAQATGPHPSRDSAR